MLQLLLQLLYCRYIRCYYVVCAGQLRTMHQARRRVTYSGAYNIMGVELRSLCGSILYRSNASTHTHAEIPRSDIIRNVCPSFVSYIYINVMAPKAKLKALTSRAKHEALGEEPRNSFVHLNSYVFVLTSIVFAVLGWQVATWPARGTSSVAGMVVPDCSSGPNAAGWVPPWLARLTGRDDAVPRLIKWLEGGGVNTSAMRISTSGGMRGLEVGPERQGRSRFAVASGSTGSRPEA
jgi:hypothetical protein